MLRLRPGVRREQCQAGVDRASRPFSTAGAARSRPGAHRGRLRAAQGVIQHATINNLAFGRNVEETLRILQAIQYVQENPDEVCPAGWKPGESTMKPDPKGSKEYFAAL